MYSFICVLDFEATCDNVKGYQNEIIEFPSILLKYDKTNKNYKIIDKFQLFCKPMINNILTNFCIELTSITQINIDNGVEFPVALNKHYDWIMDNVGEEKNIIFLTCGFWDLNTMMVKECKRWSINPKNIYMKFINIKEEFKIFYNLKKTIGMAKMLNYMDLELKGRHHSGIEDCYNISRILQNMIIHGYKIEDVKINEVNYS